MKGFETARRTQAKVQVQIEGAIFELYEGLAAAHLLGWLIGQVETKIAQSEHNSLAMEPCPRRDRHPGWCRGSPTGWRRIFR